MGGERRGDDAQVPVLEGYGYFGYSLPCDSGNGWDLPRMKGAGGLMMQSGAGGGSTGGCFWWPCEAGWRIVGRVMGMYSE